MIDADIMNVKQLVLRLNQFYLEGKLVSIQNRRKKDLLATVISKGIPKFLRGHAYHIFFGGVHHLEGQRYHKNIDFQKIVSQAEEEEDPKLEAENLLIMNQVDKDMDRTFFP